MAAPPLLHGKLSYSLCGSEKQSRYARHIRSSAPFYRHTADFPRQSPPHPPDGVHSPAIPGNSGWRRDQTRHTTALAGHFLLPFHPFQHCPVPKQHLSPCPTLPSLPPERQPEAPAGILQTSSGSSGMLKPLSVRQALSTAAAFPPDVPRGCPLRLPTRQAHRSRSSRSPHPAFWNATTHTSASHSADPNRRAGIPERMHRNSS